MEDETPEYLEAYPMLRILDVARHGSPRAEKVAWFTHETIFQHELGSAELSWHSDDRIDLTYAFDPLYGQPATCGRSTLHIRYRDVGAEDQRPSFICPVHGKLTQRLFFRLNSWGCPPCQGLRNRSACISRRRRWAEERRNLAIEVGDGRPHGMRMQTYAKKLIRLREISDKVGRYDPLPDPKFRHFISSSFQIEEWQRQGVA